MTAESGMTPEPAQGDVPRVVLGDRRARPSWAGHPNVFSGAVDRVEGEPSDGGEVDVLDTHGRFVGRGVYSANGNVRVRIFRTTPGAIDDALFVRRIRRAVELRRDVLGLPAVTDAWRIVHGDGDRLPGVVADLYAGWIVLQVTNRAVADRRHVLAEALLAATGASGVWERAATDFAAREGFHPGGGRMAGEAAPDAVEIHEHGVVFSVDLVRGQKTGHFLDQRDNRHAFAAVVGERRTLDAFSGTGGFGLAALVRGAAPSAVFLDASARTLERARANAERNGVVESVETRSGDAFATLAAMADAGEQYGAVSLDPPRMATSRREAENALRGYLELNTRAISLVERGGILATSSCTSVVAEADFLRVLRDAALRARRRVQVLAVTGQAADHPWLTAVPEGRYLKHVLALVG